MRGPEIRAVPGKLDGWEIVSSAGCCVFEWERGKRCGGVVYIDAQPHDECRVEIADYAWDRGYMLHRRHKR